MNPSLAIAASPPALLQTGDAVSFEAVSRREFDRLSAAVAAGDYVPTAEQIQ